MAPRLNSRMARSGPCGIQLDFRSLAEQSFAVPPHQGAMLGVARGMRMDTWPGEGRSGLFSVLLSHFG